MAHTKDILDQLLVTFPWWVDLHGWWRTNPAYNTSFSTADPGQDFAAEAITLFGTGKGKEKQATLSQNNDDEEDLVDVENEKKEDAEPLCGELELGEILDGGMDYSEDGDDSPMADHDHGRPLPMFDDNEHPDWDNINPSEAPTPGPSSHLPSAPSKLSESSPTMRLPQSTHYVQLPQPAYQHPVAVPRLNTTQTSHLPIYSLDSPEREIRPLLSINTAGKSRAVTEDVQMEDTSGDSDTAATSRMLKTLTVHSRKASGTLGARHMLSSSGHTSSDQDSDLSPTTSHNRSLSRNLKRSRDAPADIVSKLSTASDTLIQHIQNASVVKADNKRMKMDSKMLRSELRIREAHAEREHALRSSMAAQTHERALADERTKQLQLELELEKVRLQRVVAERGLDLPGQGNSAASGSCD